jgi:hypothetical protein
MPGLLLKMLFGAFFGRDLFSIFRHEVALKKRAICLEMSVQCKRLTEGSIPRQGGTF